MGQPSPRTSQAILAVIRLPIIAAAAVGWFAAMTSDGHFVGADWMYFSECSTFMVGLVQLVALVDGLTVNRLGRPLRILRGATTSYALVTLLIYATLLAADYASLDSKLEHLAVPILALAEWLIVPPLLKLRWFVPLLWTLIPLAYLPLYVYACGVFGEPLYDFLDPRAGDFGQWVLILVVAFVGVEYAVWLAGFRRRPADAPAPPAELDERVSVEVEPGRRV